MRRDIAARGIPRLTGHDHRQCAYMLVARSSDDFARDRAFVVARADTYTHVQHSRRSTAIPRESFCATARSLTLHLQTAYLDPNLARLCGGSQISHESLAPPRRETLRSVRGTRCHRGRVRRLVVVQVRVALAQQLRRLLLA